MYRIKHSAMEAAAKVGCPVPIWRQFRYKMAKKCARKNYMVV